MEEMEFVKTFNEQQLQAINSQSKSILITACPGSGKTSVIVQRIVRLLAEGASPYDFLVITFTRKAAQQLKERLEKALEGRDVDVKKMTICTSHAFCLRIIRQWAEKIGYNENLVIYDEIDQKDIITAIIKELGFKISPTKAIKHVKSILADSISGGIPSTEAVQICKEYLAQLQKYNSLDYDLILSKAIYILQTFPEALQYYQGRFKHLFYDEFQDIASLENGLCLTLAIPNSFVVGDADQNIYSWRGTDIKYLLEYQANHPDCEMLKLEYNYRSCPAICQAANNLIQYNVQRADTKIVTTREVTVGAINIFSAQDERELVSKLADQIKDIEGKPQDMAILVRTNRQLVYLKENLESCGVAVQLVSRDKFWQLPEIKDILAFMRAIANPKDDFSMGKILKMPHLNISKKTQLEIKQRAIQNDSYLLTECYNEHFNPILDSLRVEARLGGWTAMEACDWIIKSSGYPQSLQGQFLTTRAENVQSVSKRIQEWQDTSGENSLNEFLDGLSLVSAIDSWNEESEAIPLMTIHCAKGLEWNTVFVIGCSEGLMPLPCKSETDIEEERRLFYVAITRAKERLFLGYNVKQYQYGKETVSFPSRFLEEIW